jgi:flagellar biosynthetic protein FliO
VKSSSPLGLGDWVSFAGSFLLVLCIIAALYYVLKHLGNVGISGRLVRQVQVLESHAIGNRQRIVLVRAKDREILLGISLQQITPLATWPVEEVPAEGGAEQSSATAPIISGAALKRMLGRFRSTEATKS